MIVTARMEHLCTETETRSSSGGVRDSRLSEGVSVSKLLHFSLFCVPVPQTKCKPQINRNKKHNKADCSGVSKRLGFFFFTWVVERH